MKTRSEDKAQATGKKATGPKDSDEKAPEAESADAVTERDAADPEAAAEAAETEVGSGKAEPASKADTAKADTDKADAEKADAEKADAEKADTAKADAEKADAEKADAEKADAEKADADKPAADDSPEDDADGKAGDPAGDGGEAADAESTKSAGAEQDGDSGAGVSEQDDEPAEPETKARKLPTLSRVPWLGKAVTMVVLAACAVTAGMQWNRAEGLADKEADREAVAERAEEFGQALLSYDHKDVDTARKRVLAMATDDFAKTYDVAFTGGLENVITKLEASATATARNIYIEDVGEGNARAVIVMDSEVKSTAGTRRVLGSYMDLKLTREDGQWKVTDVSSIGAVNESMTDAEGNQTAPTPAPEPSPAE